MDLALLIYGCIGTGILILLSNFIDLPYLLSRLFFRTKGIKVNTQNEGTEKDFLQIVSLWYKLKEQCDKFHLKVASDKLDEVFPLLNGILEDEKTA